MDIKKITVGVYKYTFDAPIKKGNVLYTGFITCGNTPERVFNLLHPGHNNGSNENVTLIGDNGTTVMSLKRMKEYLSL